jgi:hypothetical protein
MVLGSVLALTAAVTVVPPAAAGTGTGDGHVAGARASFNGKVIDLSRGWEGARSCVVFDEQDVRCYATDAEADAAVGYVPRRVAGSAASPDNWQEKCPVFWLCLWADSNASGRRLIFNEEYWHSLAAYGFAHQVSSWGNRQDQGSLGDGAGGVISIGYNDYVSWLGGWSDRAVDVHG